MSTQVKFGLSYNPSDTYTEGKIYFNNGGSNTSSPQDERIYLNGKDYSGVKRVTVGYSIVGSLNVDGTDVQVKGWSTKVDKVTTATASNLAEFDSSGAIQDSGKSIASIISTVQGSSEDDVEDVTIYGARKYAASILGTSSDTSADMTVHGLSAAIGTLDTNTVKTSQLGAANGVATLDANSKVPASQLPSYVDDVIEVQGATYHNNALYAPKTSGDILDYDKINSDSYTYPGADQVPVPDDGTWVDLKNAAITNGRKLYTYNTTLNKWNAETPRTDAIYIVTNYENRPFRYSGSVFIEIKASPGTTDDIIEGNTNQFWTTARAATKANIVSSPTEGDLVTLTSGGDIADSGKKVVTTFLNNVSDDNTIPTAKLVKAALDDKALIQSPTFTGIPEITTTPSANDNSHKIADTAFVHNAISTSVKYTSSEDTKADRIVLFNSTDGLSVKDGGYSITTSFGSTTSDYNLPTEKLVKTSLESMQTSITNISNTLTWDA